MHFAVLGPLTVTSTGGRPVDPGGPRLRTLLTLLLSDPGRPVAVDRITDTLRAGAPPAGATGTVHSHVSQLRRLLEPERAPRDPARVLFTRPPGYLVDAGPETLDVLRFEQLLAEGRRLLETGDAARANATLLDAQALWRGEPYVELGGEADADRARPAELRTVTSERHVEALLLLGRPEAAVAELERLKSRLAEETATAATARGLHVVWSRCADEAAVPALWPWSQVLTALGAAAPALPGRGQRAGRGRRARLRRRPHRPVRTGHRRAGGRLRRAPADGRARRPARRRPDVAAPAALPRATRSSSSS